MRIALGADDSAPLVDALVRALEARGHTLVRFGKAFGDEEQWGHTALRLARAVASGAAEQGVVCCWTGTGVTIAANKLKGVRCALSGDAETARGARKWNDANVLALSLRKTSIPVMQEILEAWFSETYAGTEDESLCAIRDVE